MVDEEICYQYLLKKNNYFPYVQKEVQSCFSILETWMAKHPYLEWVKPSGGVVCFPRFKSEVAINVDRFYEILLHKYATYVGPGQWFEQSKRSFRLGFGWETRERFAKGLGNIDKAAEESMVHRP